MNAAQLVDSIHVRLRPSIQESVRGGNIRYLVKWTVNRRDKTRSFKSKPEARRFHSQLAAIVTLRQERFDTVTGLPESMLPASSEHTFLTVSVELVRGEWTDWSAGNRRSRVESLANLAAAFVDHDRRMPTPEILRRVARDYLLQPDGRGGPVRETLIAGKRRTATEQQHAIAWLSKHSLPISALADIDILERGLAAASLQADQQPYAQSRRQATRSSLSMVCAHAVKRRLLDANPVASTRRRITDRSLAVEPNAVPTPEEARALVAGLATVSSHAVTLYRAYLTLLWTTGMRPSEASGLRMTPDLLQTTEDSDWGTIILRAPLVSTGRRWTTTGQPYEERDRLKARQPDAVRKVLVPPEAVRALTEHLELRQPRAGALVFTNEVGNPIDPSALAKVWRKVRMRVLDGRFATLPVYGLRHTAASTMLRGGVPVARVAQQLGNSPATLMRVYARVMSDDDDTFRDAMERVLAD